MKRTIPVCAALAALTTLAVAAGAAPAYAAGSTTPNASSASASAPATAPTTESLLDYTVTGPAPSLGPSGLQFNGAAATNGSNIEHTETVPIASITELGYNVVSKATSTGDPAYSLDVDTTGSGADITLLGEPQYNGDPANASNNFDVTGWNFWDSALDPSAAGGSGSPEPLSWWATQYPSAIVRGHGIALDQTAQATSAFVTSTSFNGITTDFTLGAQTNPITTSTAPAGGTDTKSATFTGVNQKTGLGTEHDVWTASSAFGTVYYNVTTANAKAPKVSVSKAPSISGTAQVGKTLTANLGTVTPTGAKLSYQWLLSGKAISGATSKTLTPGTSSYVGKKLSVTVTAAIDGYVSYAATSAQTAAIKVGTLTAPVPTISGTAAVGKSLTLKAGTWTSGTTLHYQWYASGKALSGQTHSTLSLGTAEYGKTITVKVSGSKSGYTSVAKTSKATGKIGKGTLTVSKTPTITSSSSAGGTPIVGSTLTAHSSGWTSGTSLHYQWYANSTAIKGATSSTYKIPASLSGHTFYVHVTGSKTDYNSLAKNSAATAKAIQTLAYYKSHSGNKTEYKFVVTGLEGLTGAGVNGDPGGIIAAWGTKGAANPTGYFVDSNNTSYTETITVPTADELDVLVDPGFDNAGNAPIATLKLYSLPAGAPSVYYSLARSMSGSEELEIGINDPAE
ncbi:hypothetical protein ACFOYW_12860 [Gryllotalpicola reticulitermitis]|uniref:Ig-like domain-containing protein n=1 Tax=Gryllotalpicola reticulitermitis TaxID=1184153 RepID=A0ABV8Q7B7_9MICO